MREFIFDQISTWLQELAEYADPVPVGIGVYRKFLLPLPSEIQHQILARIFEEHQMEGVFTGQSSDVPCFFTQEEWREIDRHYPVSDEKLRPFLQCAEDHGILSGGWT